MEAVLFDMDGTLTRPILDFTRIKDALGCPQNEPILEWLEAQPVPQQERLHAILIDHEVKSAHQAVAADGACEVVEWLKSKGYKLGIVTRNCLPAVAVTLKRCKLDIAELWTREDLPRKPSGRAVAGLCRKMGVSPSRSLVVGDFKFDMDAAREAGAGAVLLVHNRHVPDWADAADVVIHDLRALKGLL